MPGPLAHHPLLSRRLRKVTDIVATSGDHLRFIVWSGISAKGLERPIFARGTAVTTFKVTALTWVEAAAHLEVVDQVSSEVLPVVMHWCSNHSHFALYNHQHVSTLGHFMCIRSVLWLRAFHDQSSFLMCHLPYGDNTHCLKSLHTAPSAALFALLPEW